MQSLSSERSYSPARCCTLEWLRHCIWLLQLAVETALLLFRYASSTESAGGNVPAISYHHIKWNSVADVNVSPAKSSTLPMTTCKQCKTSRCTVWIWLHYCIDDHINKTPEAPSWIHTKNITKPEMHSTEWHIIIQCWKEEEKKKKATSEFYNLIYKIEGLFHCLSAMQTSTPPRDFSWLFI